MYFLNGTPYVRLYYVDVHGEVWIKHHDPYALLTFFFSFYFLYLSKSTPSMHKYSNHVNFDQICPKNRSFFQ
jgi:hypothetical protein